MRDRFAGTIGVMARTPVSKARLESMMNRLDWLESSFRMLSRDLPGRLIDALAKSRVVATSAPRRRPE